MVKRCRLGMAQLVMGMITQIPAVVVVVVVHLVEVYLLVMVSHVVMWFDDPHIQPYRIMLWLAVAGLQYKSPKNTGNEHCKINT